MELVERIAANVVLVVSREIRPGGGVAVTRKGRTIGLKRTRKEAHHLSLSMNGPLGWSGRANRHRWFRRRENWIEWFWTPKPLLLDENPALPLARPRPCPRVSYRSGVFWGT